MKDFFTSRFATIGNYLDTQHFAWADLKNLFSWSYWNETGLLPQTPYSLATLICVVVLVALLVFWRKRIKVAQTKVPIYESSINQLANIIAFVLIMSVSYLFFRSQQIAYLSSRLVVLASLVIILVWTGWVAFYVFRTAPAKSREYLERERFFRYIPKKKEKSSEKK
ncbi:MAG: hypothetical protein NUV80_05895 [Candidatus Berkelbacteria bacterium]|nr:hypothetical protein [Candidatus Berkelbacteria bacterium]MCR4308065.1 hypothetical protein [Candidatus Berkelbacteria bacterium]